MILSEHFSEDGKRSAKVVLVKEPSKHFQLQCGDGDTYSVKICSSEQEAENLAEDWVL
jgi:hypothetical protein